MLLFSASWGPLSGPGSSALAPLPPLRPLCTYRPHIEHGQPRGKPHAVLKRTAAHSYLLRRMRLRYRSHSATALKPHVRRLPARGGTSGCASYCSAATLGNLPAAHSLPSDHCMPSQRIAPAPTHHPPRTPRSSAARGSAATLPAHPRNQRRPSNSMEALWASLALQPLTSALQYILAVIFQCAAPQWARVRAAGG